MDIEGRERLTDEARDLIHQEFNLSRDSIGLVVDRVLADLKYRLVKKLDEEALELLPTPMAANTRPRMLKRQLRRLLSYICRKNASALAIYSRSSLSSLKPRHRNYSMALAPCGDKTPTEKIVVFATYLGTVDLIAGRLNRHFLARSGGAARRRSRGKAGGGNARFRLKDGPRVLVCTAAGREGINLQFARILFNFDLPWNPMDVEQRIGRIHRYGQSRSTRYTTLCCPTPLRDASS